MSWFEKVVRHSEHLFISILDSHPAHHTQGYSPHKNTLKAILKIMNLYHVAGSYKDKNTTKVNLLWNTIHWNYKHFTPLSQNFHFSVFIPRMTAYTPLLTFLLLSYEEKLTGFEYTNHNSFLQKKNLWLDCQGAFTNTAINSSFLKLLSSCLTTPSCKAIGCFLLVLTAFILDPLCMTKQILFPSGSNLIRIN